MKYNVYFLDSFQDKENGQKGEQQQHKYLPLTVHWMWGCICNILVSDVLWSIPYPFWTHGCVCRAAELKESPFRGSDTSRRGENQGVLQWSWLITSLEAISSKAFRSHHNKQPQKPITAR